MQERNVHLKGALKDPGRLVRAVESVDGVLSVEVEGEASVRVLFNPQDTSEEEVDRAVGAAQSLEEG